VAFVQPLSKRLWSSAFLPVTHGGVGMRPGARPVLYLDDGLALPAAPRRELFDAVRALNDEHFKVVGDPDIAQRNYAYEVAANMQNSVAELADLSSEPEEVYDLYGPASRVSGTFAANCLRTRRLLERDVRCVLLMHRGVCDARSALRRSSCRRARRRRVPRRAELLALRQLRDPR
jgi:hypothetical protein